MLTKTQLFYMLPYLRNRETVFLTPSWADQRIRNIRMLRCHNVQALQFWIDNLNVNKRGTVYNYYYSIAKFRTGIPLQNADMEIRKPINKEFTDNFKDHCIGYDLLIDIDSSSHKEINTAKLSALSIHTLFNVEGIPHKISFSGMGFHIIIPTVYLPEKSFDHTTEDNIYGWCYRVAKFLYDNVSELIDLHIYDHRRVCKVPYSTVQYDGINYISQPMLTTGQLENFRLEDYKNIIVAKDNIFNEDGNINSILKWLNEEKASTTRKPQE